MHITKTEYFRTDGPKNGPNCLLSDITQRDLLPNVDFIHDPNTWMFSWDNSKPECANAALQPPRESGNALVPSGNRGIGNLNRSFKEKLTLTFFGMKQTILWMCGRFTV